MTTIEHVTSSGHRILAKLYWELWTPEDSSESRWVLRWDVTVDGMYANLWGPETYEGAEYVAVRTRWYPDLFCVPRAKWVEPPCPDPAYVRPAPPDISHLAGTYLYEQEVQRRARMPRRI